MKIIWNENHIRAIHSDNQDVEDKYPNPVLYTQVMPAQDEDGNLLPDQDPTFLADTGLVYDGSAWSLSLDGYKSARLTRVRQIVAQHIEADWPIWRQINADAGIYPAEVKAQKDADIAACITESNRVEDAIDAAIDVAGVDAAVASLNLPTLPVVI